MALTPEQIQEMNNIARGATNTAPSVQSTQKPSSGGILADESGDWGITSAAKSLTRNVLSAPISAAKTMLMPSINMSQKTMQLAADFGEKHLGADNPFTQGFRTAEKNIDYNKQLAFNTGTLGKTSENFGGRLGEFTGEFIPYFANKAKTLPGKVAYDTGVAYAQTGSKLVAAQTGLVSAATGFAGPLISATSKLLRGGKVKPVTDLITKTDIAKKYLGNVAKGTATGYVAGTTQNLAEGEGSEAFIPDVTSLVGGVIGGVQGVKPLKSDMRKLNLQSTKANMSKEVGKAFQGTLDQEASVKNVVQNHFTVDEIKNAKSAEDFSKLSQSKLDIIETGKREALAKSPVVKNLNDLIVNEKVDVGGGKIKDVPINHVKTGLKQLRDYFQKTAPQKIAIIDEYTNKANNGGLTASDIEDIAQLHSREISSKAYNAEGKLSTGVTKEAVANTRNGLKTTSREMSGNADVLEKADKQISDLIVVKELSDKITNDVHKFENKVYELKLGDNVKNSVKNLVYGLKFAASKFLTGMVSNQQVKLSPVEIQKNMNKTLVEIKSVLGSGKSEDDIIKALDAIAAKQYVALPSGEKLKQQIAREAEQTRIKNTKLLSAPTSNFQGKPVALPGESTKTVGQRESRLYQKPTMTQQLRLPAPKPLVSIPLKPSQSYTGDYNAKDKSKIKNDTGGYERKSPLLKNK